MGKIWLIFIPVTLTESGGSENSFSSPPGRFRPLSVTCCGHGVPIESDHVYRGWHLCVRRDVPLHGCNGLPATSKTHPAVAQPGAT